MIVSALARTVPEKGHNAHIVFIPEGESTITPTVNGKPQKITVRVSPNNGEEVAQKLQKDLAGRHAQNVRPIFDFDHKDTGPAAAIPKRFYYEGGKGIMSEVEWTGAGKKAIEAKDYSYFSPVFLIGKDGSPNGLPSRGPLGALVNDPAFRDIPRIAASYAADFIKTDTNQTKKQMDDLVKCGLLKSDEAEKDNAATVAATRVTSLREDAKKVEAMSSELDALKAKKAELEKQIADAEEATKKDKANAEIDAAVADGRIAPKDEETKEFYRESIMEKGEKAVKALNALPKREDLTKQQVKAKDAKQTDASGIEAEAAKLIQAGDAADKEEAFAMVAESNPDLYDEYCKNL